MPASTPTPRPKPPVKIVEHTERPRPIQAPKKTVK
jgi:hypothetical protein